MITCNDCVHYKHNKCVKNLDKDARDCHHYYPFHDQDYKKEVKTNDERT